MNTHFFFATIYDEQTNLSDAIKSCRSPFFSICIRYISISVGCYYVLAKYDVCIQYPPSLHILTCFEYYFFHVSNSK